MEKNNMIMVILIIIIIILIAAIAIVLMPSFEAKQDCKVVIATNETLYEGENLTVNLETLNGTPISGETVNITITNGDGSKDYKTAVTDLNGSAHIKLDKLAGNYTVNCSFGGNKNYSSNSTTQKLVIIKEVVEQSTSPQSSSSSSSSSKSSSSEYRPAVDSGGVTREEADYYGWKYTPEHGGHYHGSHDAWDEEAGVYHD